MAFVSNKLNIVADNFGGNARIWSYVSADNCTAGNYFDGASKRLAKGDVIIAGKDATTEGVDVLLVTAVTPHVTVTKAAIA